MDVIDCESCCCMDQSSKYSVLRHGVSLRRHARTGDTRWSNKHARREYIHALEWHACAHMHGLTNERIATCLLQAEPGHIYMHPCVCILMRVCLPCSAIACYYNTMLYTNVYILLRDVGEGGREQIKWCVFQLCKTSRQTQAHWKHAQNDSYSKNSHILAQLAVEACLTSWSAKFERQCSCLTFQFYCCCSYNMVE